MYGKYINNLKFKETWNFARRGVRRREINKLIYKLIYKLILERSEAYIINI